MTKLLPTEIPPPALPVRDAYTYWSRREAALQQKLEQAQHENRVRGECLSIALGALQHTNRLSIFEIQARVVEIKRRLAELEPEEGG